MTEMTWAQVCARRLVRHGLNEPVAAENLAAAVGAMCGAHAQIMSAAEVSVALRVSGATRQSVRAALGQDRSIVKTYGPRGTVHLLAARDLPMWSAALSAMPPTTTPWPAHIRMTDAQTEQVIAAIGDALIDGEMTGDELSESVISRTGAWAGDPVVPAFQGAWPRWRQAITLAANRGVLCFGANRGRNVTYTNPRRIVPDFAPAEQKSAVGELLKRYLHAYGPATTQQVAQWLSVPKTWVAAQFDAISGDLEHVTVDGETAWVVKGDTEMPEHAPEGVRLLPYFDAYVVGCHPREKLFPGRALKRALAKGQAGNIPVLLIDGVVAGVWHQRKSGKKIALTVEPFVTLTAAQREELDAQVLRTGEILEAAAEMTLGEVTARPHL